MTEAAIALRAATNPWPVAATVVVPTVMEVLDTTIAVVALRYIAGGLSASISIHLIQPCIPSPNNPKHYYSSRLAIRSCHGS